MRSEVELPAEPTSPKDARLFVAHWARTWGYQRIIDAAALLTSELATNAVIHGSAPFTVSVSNTGRGIRVDVEDVADGMPELRSVEDVDVTGRGLHMVDTLSSRWGVDPVDDGSGRKRVWFEVETAGTPRLT